MKQRKVIKIVIPKKLHSDIRKLAEKSCLSVNGFICYLLMDAALNNLILKENLNDMEKKDFPLKVAVQHSLYLHLKQALVLL